MELFGIPLPALSAQILMGLVNGAFYAVLSLGLAVIFGMLNIINFSHGALYMMSAFLAWLGMQVFGLNYWAALVVVPPVVGLLGILIERFLLRRLHGIDHLYGLLLTFGIALIIEGLFIYFYGTSSRTYPTPELLRGGTNLGFMFLPNYRGWIVAVSLVVCLLVWLLIEKTKIGAYLRAGTENPQLLGAFGVNVPLLITLTFGGGVALAGFAGVLAAPITGVMPLMGAHTIIVVFAIVVIGGLGSILGSVLTGLGMGVVEGLTRVFYPEASSVVIFLTMAIVLLLRPAGLFGKTK